MLQIKLFCIVGIFIIVFAGVPLAAQGNQEQPAVAMDATGNFVVCWQDNHSGDYDIWAQRYDYAGNPQGTNFRVNEDGSGNSQEAPTAAMDAAGNFLMCWQDNRTGNYETYAQRYDAAGNSQGTNFRVNVPEYTQVSVVAMDAIGNFLMCWQDTINGDTDIYAQWYDAVGNPQGTNLILHVPEYAEAPGVAMDATGNFVVSWQDNHTGNYAIYVQRYDAAGNLQGTSFKVNESGYAEASAVATDATGNFVVCWQDDRTGDYDIWAESYDAAGNPQGINFRANDDAGQEFQQFSAVAMDAAGNFVMCWQDSRADDYEIWFQRFDAAGMPQGINFRVH